MIAPFGHCFFFSFFFLQLWLETLSPPPYTHILRVMYFPEKRQSAKFKNKITGRSVFIVDNTFLHTDVLQ